MTEQSTSFQRRWYHSILAKLGGALLLSLLVVGALNVLLTIIVWYELSKNIQQLQYWDLAEELTIRLQPNLSHTIDKEQITRTMYEMSIGHPTIDFYLLSENGEIIFSLQPESHLIRKKVDLKALRLADSTLLPDLPILADDPRTSKQAIFSVAMTTIQGKPGYVYLILSNALGSALNRKEGQYYILGYASILSLLSVFLTVFLASFFFIIVSKGFRRLLATVRSYQGGELSARVPVTSNDEVAELSVAINVMAEQIQASLEKLETTDQARRQLIANVSHDLRGPLMIIEGYQKLLQEQWHTLDEQKRDEYLTTIRRNIEQQKKLIADLFDLSKLEARDKILEKEQFSIAELCSDIVQERRETLVSADQKLRLDFSEAVPEVVADIALISRVLINLIENASQHSGSDSEIVVQLLEQQNEVEVKVSDNGVGIPAEDIPHIFESFYQADKSRSSSKQGSGLGLAIVKSILEVHGKAISVDSQQNGGTTFSFTLDSVKNE